MKPMWLVTRKKPIWIVRWLHSTTNSSWWGTEVVYADTADDAARAILRQVETEKHTRPNERMKVRVYGPVPKEAAEFEIGYDPQAVNTAVPNA